MTYLSDPQFAPPKARPVLPARWLQKTETVLVNDVELAAALIYFGTSEGTPPHTNPAMVDPFLRVGRIAASPQSAPTLEFLPDYRYLTEAQRLSFLYWLSSGRRDPDCPESYVLLFLLGLERRILVDYPQHLESPGELSALAEELAQLRQQYAALSVSTTIQALLEYVQLGLKGHEVPSETESAVLRLEKNPDFSDLEISKRLRYCAQTGEPVEVALAYALLRSAHRKELNSIAFKDETIFRKQFHRLFDEHYQRGFQLSLDASRKEPSYQPLCPDLEPYVVPLLPALNESVLHERTQELLWLAFCAARDLQPFEQAAADLARHPHLLSLALLDSYLPGDRERPIVRKLTALTEHVATKPVEFSAQELAAWFGEEGDLPQPAREFLANTLNYHGITTSPDLRKLDHPDDTVQVFVGDAPPQPCLATAQPEHLEQVVFLASILGKNSELSQDESLFVHEFLDTNIPGRRHLKSELLEPLEDGTLSADSLTRAASLRYFTRLTEAQRSVVARFLFALTHLETPPSAHQTRILARVYPLLGIAVQHLQTDLTAHKASAAPDAYSFNHALDELDNAVFETEVDVPASSRTAKPTADISLENVILLTFLPEPERPLASCVFERALDEFTAEVRLEAHELSLGDLLMRLGIAGTISKTLLKMVSEAFIERGLALDPDPRWQMPGHADVLMRVYFGKPKALPILLNVPLERLHAAAEMFSLLTANSNASPEEESQVSTFFSVETTCSPGELRILKHTFEGSHYFGRGRTTSIRKLEGLTRPERQGLAEAFFKFCHVAREPSPLQIQRLERLYLALGYPSRALYSDLHAQATGASADEFSFSEQPGAPLKQSTHIERMARPPAVGSGANSVFNIKTPEPEPVSREYSSVRTSAPTSLSPSARTHEYRPLRTSAPTSLSHNAPTRTLNKEKLAARREETREVQAMLAAEFNAYDVAQAAQSLVPPPSQEGLIGLDARHTQFVRDLLTRSSWPREDALALAASLGLRLDGAYEIVNEAAFYTLDDALLEGDDPIDLNPDIVEKLKNGNGN